ncbi:hypothetical protein OV079_06690 [Nannocystis pusilla]|uniref:Uncharacterized protein n=1 Tax=Nannocystis pusilla TaxID=889268 RepID=A0A9X3IWY2_9BACT|nr:hypothetical protein [Nannocystis pusilla]MCY1005263.1 hypothetical protein [Nannocystis pusilla]
MAMRRVRTGVATAAAWAVLGCGDDGRGDSAASGSASSPITTATEASTATEPTTTTAGTTAPTTAGGDSESTGEATTAGTTAPTTTSAVGCQDCTQPHQQCIAGECVSGCQGQADACGPGQVCDVISGECKDGGDGCTLAGPSAACDSAECGPGSACDGQGGCIAVAPCLDVACTDDGRCWGTQCSCERTPSCGDPPADLLNGPFSADISALDFADDCTAWAVTVSGGQEFVRRMSSAGEMEAFGAIGDYDLGEVRVLRNLVIPRAAGSPALTAAATPPSPVEGNGEVALTYICCPSCGSCANNPSARGVARLVEDDPVMPLPIVIYAEPTQGTGPFGQMHLDGGPQGLTWGENRVLYVGNAVGDGDYSSADLEAGTVDSLYTFDARVSASAPVSPVHNLVALLEGELYRFNVVTHEAEFVVDVMADVTGLSHDAFDGHVYASLSTLEVVRVHPFTGAALPFATMPAKGRVAVSPSGALWFTPVKYLNAGALQSWPLPTGL